MTEYLCLFNIFFDELESLPEWINYSNCIYRITNFINGKDYVGSAHKFIDRFRLQGFSHLNQLNDCNEKKYTRKILYNAINKYGEESFYVQVLEHDVDNLGEREKFWISSLGSLMPNGYNMTEGGESFCIDACERSYKVRLAKWPESNGVAPWTSQAGVKAMREGAAYSKFVKKFNSFTNSIINMISDGIDQMNKSEFLKYRLPRCPVFSKKSLRFLRDRVIKYNFDDTLFIEHVPLYKSII